MTRNSEYKTKERFLNVFQKVNMVILNEAVLPKDKKEKEIHKFIKFAADWLELGDDLPKIVLSYDENEAKRMKSFGKYTEDINELRVVMTNRNLADIARTIAHELIHNKQRIDGKLKPDSSETGSEIENEANALAGIIMREYGQLNPIIFE